MIQDCSSLLSNVDRLEALRDTKLFGTAPEEAFTRLNNLATKILHAPISIFSLIGHRSQFFKSAAGFTITPENNEVPIDVSVCQYSLQGKPFSLEDTQNHPAFMSNAAVKALNIVGYLGIPVITKDGHAIGAVCVIDHKKRIWTAEEISLLQDLTASFVSEIELRQAIARVEEEARLREEFIAVASHELKTPLSTVKLQTQMARMMLSRKTFDVKASDSFLSTLERQTKRLELMVDDMSDATRLSTGKVTLYKTPVTLNTLLTDVVQNLGPSLADSGCTVRIEAPAVVTATVDETRLEQVLTNLLSNAAKYAPGSQVVVRVEAAPEAVILSVRDSGPGIGPEFHDRIFEKYVRVDRSASVKGLGLGLFISRQIIEEHGGSLRLESRAGEGSTFTITLPI